MLCDIPTQWIRSTDDELDPVFAHVCEFLRCHHSVDHRTDDVRRTLILDLMARVDPDARWFTAWTLTHFGRQRLFQHLAESNAIINMTVALFERLSNVDNASHHGAIRYILTIVAHVVRFEGGRRLFIDRRTSVMDVMLRLVHLFESRALPRLIADNLVAVFYYWTEDAKVADLLNRVCPCKRISVL